MRKYLILAICLIASTIAHAQLDTTLFTIKNDKIVIEKVLPYTITQEQAQRQISDYLNYTMFRDNEDKFGFEREDYRFYDLNHYYCKMLTGALAYHTMDTWSVRAELTIDIRIKEGRAKVVITCERLINQGFTTRTKVYIYSPLEAAPFVKKHPAWRINLVEKASLKAADNLQLVMKIIFLQVKTSLFEQKNEDDNW